jgi:hypothetical protein
MSVAFRATIIGGKGQPPGARGRLLFLLPPAPPKPFDKLAVMTDDFVRTPVGRTLCSYARQEKPPGPEEVAAAISSLDGLVARSACRRDDMAGMLCAVLERVSHAAESRGDAAISELALLTKGLLRQYF